ncbi:hypothetical protein P3T36_006876 [Kitasatospora sp. MAP12-15]|uniref:hypothetical protein n=1 Tax=unclassified Kitasatospora TaxID=2633591 RepID=UPI00247700D6|nr:hypothetical protein [Kitasatospora sp. MAP12-44]MDH6111941.1 hypothetical protein [Kitasatospora sp. MAP12-44]
MPVYLFPPITTSPCRIDAEPLTEGPRFVRTDRMSRWHRVRSGIRYGDSHTVYNLWCAGSVHGDSFLAREQLPDGERVCGPCDGRAVGSGQEPAGPAGRALLFTPQALAPPRYCPGSRNQRLTAAIPPGTVGQCLACGDLHPIRAMGGPYNGRAAITQHAPGRGLVAPCPFHRWRYLTPVGDAIECSCGRPLNTPPGETK